MNIPQTTNSNQIIDSRKAAKPKQNNSSRQTEKSTKNNNKELLEILFANKIPEHFILVWRKEGERKISDYFSNWNDAQKFAESKRDIADVYFGLATSTEVTPQNKRIKANEVTGISSLFLDIDFKSEAHAKNNLPPSENDALALINKMPVSPSIIVHSGHGFQIFYLFSNFIEINDEQTRTRISNLSEKWQRLIKEKAKQFGWDVDSTFDLARVFRVSNTLNHKVENDKPVVRVVKHSKKTYSLEQLENLVGNVEVKPKSVSLTKSVSVTPDAKNNCDFELSKDAEKPEKKFEALCKEEPKFLLSWERKRDMQDQSASSYDLSLANYAVRYGWTSQETVNLLIASRKKHGDDLKLRYDYYAITLSKARNTTNKDNFEQTVTDKPQDLQLDESNDEERIKQLRYVENKFQFKKYGFPELTHVRQFGASKSVYQLEFADGRKIELGSTLEMLSQSKLSARLGEQKVFIKTFNTSIFKLITQAIMTASEVVDIGSESDDLVNYLRRYFHFEGGFNQKHGLDTNKSYTADFSLSNEEIANHLRTVSREGFIEIQSKTVWLGFNKFLEWLNWNSGTRWSDERLKIMLSQNGFKVKQKTIHYEDKQGQPLQYNAGRFWVSPVEYAAKISNE
jgi:putative DNA primase/helicase